MRADIKLLAMDKSPGKLNSGDPQENDEISELNKKIEMLTYQLKRSEEQLKSKEVDLEKVAYQRFRNDIKGRLRFIDKLMDFNKLSNEVNGVVPKKKPLNFFQKIGKAIIEDGQLAHEHFTASKSELGKLMEAAYFPVVDCQEHNELFSR